MSYQSKHTAYSRQISHDIEDLQRKIRYYYIRIRLCESKIITKKEIIKQHLTK